MTIDHFPPEAIAGGLESIDKSDWSAAVKRQRGLIPHLVQDAFRLTGACMWASLSNVEVVG